MIITSSHTEKTLKTRSLGTLQAPTSSFAPFGPSGHETYADRFDTSGSPVAFYNLPRIPIPIPKDVKHMRALSLIKTSNSNSSSSFKLIISQNPPKLAFALGGPACRDIIQTWT